MKHRSRLSCVQHGLVNPSRSTVKREKNSTRLVAPTSHPFLTTAAVALSFGALHIYLVRLWLGVFAHPELRRERYAGVSQKAHDLHRAVVAERSLFRVALADQSLRLRARVPPTILRRFFNVSPMRRKGKNDGVCSKTETRRSRKPDSAAFQSFCAMGRVSSAKGRRLQPNDMPPNKKCF